MARRTSYLRWENAPGWMEVMGLADSLSTIKLRVLGKRWEGTVVSLFPDRSRSTRFSRCEKVRGCRWLMLHLQEEEEEEENFEGMKGVVDFEHECG